MQIKTFNSLPKDTTHQLGLIVLQSDITIEDEFRYFLDGLPISLLVNRIPFENEVTIDTLKAMEQHIETSMSLFPIDAQFDVLGYGCTSGALHIGDDSISNLVQGARQCSYVSNPMQAAVASFQALEAKNIAYLAPYSEQVSQSMVDKVEQHGVTVTTAATFNEHQDKEVGRIAPESIKKACIELAKESNVDAIFVACTNMKCASIIPEVEQETGIATLSSNQALAWHMLNQIGCAMPENKGRLFACQ